MISSMIVSCIVIAILKKIGCPLPAFINNFESYARPRAQKILIIIIFASCILFNPHLNFPQQP
jgi:hypothetical protein